MSPRLPYADEPAIPGLFALSFLVPALWIAAATARFGEISADCAILVFGLGLALAITATGLAGLRYVRRRIGPGETYRGVSALLLHLIVLAAATLVAIGGSAAVIVVAMALHPTLT